MLMFLVSCYCPTDGHRVLIYFHFVSFFVVTVCVICVQIYCCSVSSVVLVIDSCYLQLLLIMHADF